ncbi:16S rRNA (adenine(1518)-N(6)/adenine(1519)-N(6))-dimethyltransferase RsmA [Vallitalea guaymasensis]|uniref:Ribosomal RNA small subunit methyltransferase A n=1 Tax=Vallitalea guaymasensis TaxID=1185412 RepID=A0A8J8MFJ7_9FIRM|nr:16S rRNA (adenine(1518)-N(6)/adenine(1519)-N(6))-dimethyltransferase RsmA [Vallitalea guaymasensis]QUH31992.1 16S rRNA (adenine(1518)-N(6)/adenine(1519)-N(6))-dimethyltransferase RsmA [Vallitalea guaymasensis]
MTEPIASPKKTIEIIKKYDFAFQKKFGQNFLIDSHVLNKIITSSNITKEDVVIEIGPGIGSLTQQLAENAKQVIAVEIDKKLIPILEDTLSDYNNITIINEDILKVDIVKLVEEKNDNKPIKVVANLPYYITTPIIMGLFESNVPVDSITVMVQKEVADRMKAKPGTKDYGALSLAVGYYSEPYIVANVPPNCFMPRPKIGSAVIKLTKHKQPPVDVEDAKLLFKIIRASFNQRRKTLINGLYNNLDGMFDKDQLKQAIENIGLKLNVRGETLSLEEFSNLANELYKLIK